MPVSAQPKANVNIIEVARCRRRWLIRYLTGDTPLSTSECFNTPAIKFKEKLNAEVVRLYLHIKLGRRELGQWLLKDYERSAEAPAPQS